MYHLNRNTISLMDCLGLGKVDRLYYVSGQDINPSTGKAYALNPNRGWVWDDNYFAENYGGEYERRNGGRKYGESEGTFIARKNREASEKLAAEAKADMARREQEQKDLLAKQKLETDQRFTENRNLLGGLTNEFKEAVPQVFDQAYANFNIPGLLDMTNGLKNRINDLRENFSGHGAGGFASGSQVDKAVGTKYLPKYLSANEGLQKGVSLAQNEIAVKLDPYKTKIQVMNDQIAREMTGYDHGQQRELDTLLAQLNAGVSLTQAQMGSLTSLANSEMNYSSTLAKIQADRDAQAADNEIKKQQLAMDKYKIDNTLKSMGKYGLYDPQTGQVVGSNASGGSGGGSGNPWLDFLG